MSDPAVQDRTLSELSDSTLSITYSALQQQP